MGKKLGLDKQYANIGKGYLQHPVINSVKPKPKPSKLSAGGEMNQMNIKGYMGGGASRGYGAARTSGMGLQDESLMPGKMVRASEGKAVRPYNPKDKKQKKITDKQNPHSLYDSKTGKLKYTPAKEGKMLSLKQKKIARMAPPPDKITGADFKAMKAKNGKMVKAGLGTFIKDMFGQKQRTASVSPTTDALTGDKNMEVRKIIMNKFKNKMGAKHGKHMKK